MFYLNKDHDPKRGENILFKILFWHLNMQVSFTVEVTYHESYLPIELGKFVLLKIIYKF